MSGSIRVASQWVPDEGEIIWINFTPQAGKEMNGRHPFLVLSTKIFNEKTQTVVGLAMTSQAHNDAGLKAFNPFQIENKTSKNEPSFINTNQISTFDWDARQASAHPWGRVNKIVLVEAKEYLNSILNLAS